MVDVTLKKKPIYLNISNVGSFADYRKYVVAIMIFLALILIIDGIIYYALIQTKKSREEYFISAYQESIISFLKPDLILIFDSSKEISHKNLLSNFAANPKPIGNKFVLSGTLLQVPKGHKTLVVDILPFTNVIQHVLNKDFYYQISLNKNIMATNAIEIEFASIKSFKVYKNIILTLKLLPKVDSPLFKESYKRFIHHVKILFISSLGILVFFLPLIFYLIRKQGRNRQLISQLHSLNEALEFNLRFIRKCYSEDKGAQFPIPLSPTDKIENLDINQFIRSLNTYALGYTALYQYKFELIIESSIDTILIKGGVPVMEQILISLFHNMLYFMRGGSHIKKIKIIFTKEDISFTYDSFLANETHMANWSCDIFEHTGNLYILDTQKTFELIKNCNLSYEILPKQGANKVIINLQKTQEENNIVQFTKNNKN